MEITLINQSDETAYDAYAEIFMKIADRTKEILKLKEEKELSVIFLNDDEIHKMNREYRNIDRPTDVISFALCDEEEGYEMPEGQNEIGDIFISVDAMKRQAKEYGHGEKREMCFLFTHGLLHLLGYDHMEKADEEEMFRLQDVILDDLVPKENY